MFKMNAEYFRLATNAELFSLLQAFSEELIPFFRSETGYPLSARDRWGLPLKDITG